MRMSVYTYTINSVTINKIHYRYRDTEYQITVNQIHNSNTHSIIVLDGIECQGDFILLTDDRGEHYAEVNYYTST